MTYSSNTDIQQMTDDTLVATIGKFVRFHRLEQNQTQADLAKAAGINRTTLYELEQGRRCNLVTLIQLLRTLGKLSALEGFLLNHQPSPMLLADAESKQRKRASGKTPPKPTSNW